MWIKGVNKIKRSRDVKFNKGYSYSSPNSNPPILLVPINNNSPNNKDSNSIVIYLLTIVTITP